MAFFNCSSGLARQVLLFHQVDSICISRKMGSRNYCKYLSAIQCTDQKLRLFSIIISVWRDKTYSSRSRDSIGTSRKTGCGNYYKALSAIQWSDQKLRPFQLLFRSGATRPPLKLVGIPEVLQGKRAPETTVSI